ncbi:hypothetical protein [Paraburkholderia sp. GAS41]|uniref:hypothetical protein n=1 Tax=Paraburkholderia sp. GAS41 TaxID=3035134 RepID=UPI003D2018DD
MSAADASQTAIFLEDEKDIFFSRLMRGLKSITVSAVPAALAAALAAAPFYRSMLRLIPQDDMAWEPSMYPNR